MATIGVYLNHNFIGKSTQDRPYTARAHSRYIQRQSATQAVHTYLLPENYKARQRWFFDHENGLRKNGRVIDKFIIAVPRGITEEHAAQVLMKFGKHLGQERAPFMFSLQGFDSPNHHAHFIFIDRDVETGARIYGTTERNSTKGIKLEWERVANQAFEELGYDVRIKVHDALEAQNDNVSALEGVEEASDVDTVPDIEPEDAQTGENDMVDTLERAHDDTVSLAANDLRLLASTITELNRLKHAQTAVADAEERFTALVAQRERAAFEARIYASQTDKDLERAYQANENLQAHLTKSGKLKGIGFKVFSYEFKTGARKEAEARQHEAERAAHRAEEVTNVRQKRQHHVDVLSAEATAAERDAFMRRNELLAAYGEEKDIAEARATFENTIVKVVTSVPFEAAQEAFLAVEITPDEYQAYLEQTGNTTALEEFLENKDKYEIVDNDEDV